MAVLLGDHLTRDTAWVGLPLPPHFTPTGGAPLTDVPNSALMSGPPAVIVHVIRTAAQEGLQTISPRQTPLSGLMTRTTAEKRSPGLHIVGSKASRTVQWATIDNADLSHLLPGAPLTTLSPSETTRTRTKVNPLAPLSTAIVDPIAKCLITARALVDLQRRPDVAGDAEGLALAASKSWGISVDDFMALEGYSIATNEPLLRHGIAPDNVFPLTHAPIHERRVVSVSAVDIDKQCLPEDAAADWNRMRVVPEAVFGMACALEGVSLVDVAVDPPPGARTAPLQRRGTLVFEPQPFAGWTYAPQTFALTVDPTEITTMGPGVPPEVYDALGEYMRTCRPVVRLLDAAWEPTAQLSRAGEAVHVETETLAGGYAAIVSRQMPGVAKGRTATTAVRNAVYRMVESLAAPDRVRVARYLKLTRDECRTHLPGNEIPTRVVSTLASRIPGAGSCIREGLAAEAEKRGATIQDWWADFKAGLPEWFWNQDEGAATWLRAVLWSVFREPTAKWHKLADAVHYSALREASRSAGAVGRLPAELGSVARLQQACRNAVRATATAYAAYYGAVADVGLALAKEAQRVNLPGRALTLSESSYLWILRSRAFGQVSVSAVPCGTPRSSPQHIVVQTPIADIHVVPAPYTAYRAWVKHVAAMSMVTPAVKRYFQETAGPVVSAIFRTGPERLVAGRSTGGKVARYYDSLPRLGRDMEASWTALSEDVGLVCRAIIQEQARRMAPARPTPVVIEELAELTEELPDVRFGGEEAATAMAQAARAQEAVAGDFWAAYAQVGPEEADEIDDYLSTLAEYDEESVRMRPYAGAGDLITYIRGMRDTENQAVRAAADLVA